jgi:hypothetical protein
MNRTNVIQQISDKKSACTYLEIGVYRGRNFFPIKVNRKIGVDPEFAFSKRRKRRWIFKNFYNLRAKYYRLSSDSFFANPAISYVFDVVFIDGLHTYEQSLKDVNNALSCLSDNGVIVLHDCNPPNEAAAYPAGSLEHAGTLNLPGWSEEWCGDVWKTICHLRITRKDLKIFVLDCDHGLGIITKGESDNVLELPEQELAEMTHEDLSLNRKQLLNLKDTTAFFEFLETI